MSEIHTTAIVSADATIGENVTIGPFTIVEGNVQIGDGCQIGSTVQLGAGARLGKNVKVFHGAVIGTVPQDLKFGGEATTAEIGDNTVVREYATINRGTTYSYRTRVGKNCLLMAYSHVAHDCIIGDNVIMANSVNLAGHIEVDDFAILGGVLPVHQFVKIGAHAMVGGGFRVQQDIVPFSMAGGYPLKIVGLNSLGLKRRGFTKETIARLEQTYKLLFRAGLNTTQAVERIKSDIEPIKEVQMVLDFLERSERGIVK
jgi:UDP-N-acetylglucosamine acyltransferase